MHTCFPSVIRVGLSVIRVRSIWPVFRYFCGAGSKRLETKEPDNSIKAYVAKNKSNARRRLFYADHIVVSRFYGNVARVVRVAGENSILAGGTGAECRRNRGAAGVDASVGACLLFGDLPVGGISGRDFVDQRETEKEKMTVFRIRRPYRG